MAKTRPKTALPPTRELLRQIAVARAAEERDRKEGRRAVSAHYDRQSGRVIVELTNGFLFGFPTKIVPR